MSKVRRKIKRDRLVIVTQNRSQTLAVGAKIGRKLWKGSVVLLSGWLGAGKTVFTQGLAKGLGIKERITSPTFVLIQSYEGRLVLHHVDLYRLDSSQEIRGLGLDEYWEGEGVCAVEWAEKIRKNWPKEYLLITLKYEKDGRVITITAKGQPYKKLLLELQK